MNAQLRAALQTILTNVTYDIAEETAINELLVEENPEIEPDTKRLDRLHETLKAAAEVVLLTKLLSTDTEVSH